MGEVPLLGDWMKTIIREDFAEKNPEVVYTLLGRVWDLLQLSRVGCDGYRCSIPVLRITVKYRDVLYQAASNR